MKKILVAALMTAMAPVGANAAILLSSTPGPWVDAGFVPTAFYDFESAAPLTGGLITTGSVAGDRAQPWSSTGNYATVSPVDGTPAIFDLSQFGAIAKISLLWGSIDGYNDLDVLDGDGNVLATFNGATVVADANGDQSDPMTNRLVTLSFSDSDMIAAEALRFRSSQNAFEFDNVAILAPVPEPMTWAMMIVGLAAVGTTMRRRRTVVSFA